MHGFKVEAEDEKRFFKMKLKPANSKGSEEIDHWAFLEEIEAPMWVDLIEESKLVTENNSDDDDEWFKTSHLFHQCSARKLRSAFSHPVEGNDKFDFNLRGISSPKLPSSVSKSRGKDYRISIKGKDVNHPVKHLGSRSPGFGAAGLSEERDTKRKCADKVDRIIRASSRTGKISDSSCNGTASASSNEVSISTHAREQPSDSLASVVTTEYDWQRRNIQRLETSKPVFGHTSSLVSALRINLRKSYATRQALRVEKSEDGEKGKKSPTSNKSSTVFSSNSGDEARNMVVVPKGNRQRNKSHGLAERRSSSSGKPSVCSYSKPAANRYKSIIPVVKQNEHTSSARESKGCKSSSAKSSVGSLSKNGFKMKITVPEANLRKDRADDGNNRAKNVLVTGGGGNILKPSKTSDFQTRNVASNSTSGSATIMRTSTYQKSAMPKVRHVTVGTKMSDTLKVGKINPSSTTQNIIKKDGNKKLTRVVHPGKENGTGSMVVSRVSDRRDKTTVATLGGQKAQKGNAAGNGSRELLVGSKPKVKPNGEGDGGHKKTAQRVYFR
ncbi:hypothetical protein Dimus_019034 [Dionaea muscipula]